jgi:hypothetical protein
LIVEIVSVAALDLLHATPLNHGGFLKQASKQEDWVFFFVGVCLFFSSGVLFVLSILVCMIHHEGEKQASKQASKQMGHHYLQMGGTHCTTSSYLVPKFLDSIIGSLLLLLLLVAASS